uniref:Uncharacterized protein n=1 Tax=Panagrolaimus sp. JU765 TaxID=591449 RepID=A0AC34RRS9_9BILA
MFVKSAGCSNKTDKKIGDTELYCSTDEDCKIQSQISLDDLREKNLDCATNSGENNSTISCESQLCSTGINKGCGKGNGSGPETSTCAESMCNLGKHKCYSGYLGDCSDIFPNTNLTFPINVECDQYHVKDICVNQTWTHSKDKSKVCHFYGCHHTFGIHGVKLVRENPQRETKTFNDTIGNYNVSVTQCKVLDDSGCNLPSQSTSCRFSSDSGIGTELKCPGLRYCEYVRHKKTKAIISRGCGSSDIVKTGCMNSGEDSDFEKCYCFGDFCNNQTRIVKNCITGNRGDCNFMTSLLKDVFHTLISTKCHSWTDSFCHLSRITKDDEICSIYSCDLLNFAKDIANFYDYDCPEIITDEQKSKHCRCFGDNCFKIPERIFDDNNALAQQSDPSTVADPSVVADPSIVADPNKKKD